MDIYTIGAEDQLKHLRCKAASVEQIDSRIAQIAEEMIKAMIKSDGIGLAGPQVGLSERIFTVKIGKNDPLVFINPEIIATSYDQSTYEEGCLSIPGSYAEVKRPASVQIQAWNTKGRPFNMEAEGLLATVIQHELDHLNGVLFIDYLSERKRKSILGKFHIDPAAYPHIK